MPLKIVYLDDEPDLLDVFKDTFSEANVEISVFSDVEKAISHVLDYGADLIFLDFRLPGVTGDQVARRLPQNIPKVLFTGELSVTCDAHFVAKFSKPFKDLEVRALIQAHLDRKSVGPT